MGDGDAGEDEVAAADGQEEPFHHAVGKHLHQHDEEDRRGGEQHPGVHRPVADQRVHAHGEHEEHERGEQATMQHDE